MRSRCRTRTYCRRLCFEPLEERRVLAAGFAEFFDPHPAAGNRFGEWIVPLATGNVVITAPYDDAGGTDAGAVYLFNGRTGALISTLLGSHTNDHVGSGLVTALTNGNFVVVSYEWDSNSAANVGAVTFGSGMTGVNGAVSAANSLVGSKAGDQVGSYGVTALTNGNYVVRSPNWDSGSIIVNIPAAGAATFGNGTSGISGAVSSLNSLVGSTANDMVGNSGVIALTNGNYVVLSRNWDGDTAMDVGAVSFGNGVTGIKGAVSAANSLVGTSPSDSVAFVAALTNGNYVVASPLWDNGTSVDVGAVTWASGTTGITGIASAANSLIGSTAFDKVGEFGVTALINGNYVVNSLHWDNGMVVDAGAVTFGNGTTGISGVVSAANSLVGTTNDDLVGIAGVTPLTNGNYVVTSYYWDNGMGAVTFGSGTSGISGTISDANSLVGSQANDSVGFRFVTALSNGNYVVSSPYWHNGAVPAAGAVTFGNGTSGISGPVTGANSLVGSTANDHVGSRGTTALTNGNYVVVSTDWTNSGLQGSGAVTFGSGTSGVKGAISGANSLVGTSKDDFVGIAGVTPLTNGNYVVSSGDWDNGTVIDVGAATFGDGMIGVRGAVSAANSLIGSQSLDRVGSISGENRVKALASGNYVVASPDWNNGDVVDAGAVTFGSGTSGVTDIISIANNNSIVGGIADSDLRRVVVDDVNKTFICPFLAEGRVRVGSQIDGFAHHWHFAAEPLDVNNDAHVAANDVVAIVNYINAGFLSAVVTGAPIGQPFGFLDVTGDDFVAPNDAVAVINAINAGMGGEGDGASAECGVRSAECGAVIQQTDAATSDFNALMMLLAMDGNAPAGRRRGY